MQNFFLCTITRANGRTYTTTVRAETRDQAVTGLSKLLPQGETITKVELIDPSKL